MGNPMVDLSVQLTEFDAGRAEDMDPVLARFALARRIRQNEGGIATHLADLANPHGVTAAQIGAQGAASLETTGPVTLDPAVLQVLSAGSDATGLVAQLPAGAAGIWGTYFVVDGYATLTPAPGEVINGAAPDATETHNADSLVVYLWDATAGEWIVATFSLDPVGEARYSEAAAPFEVQTDDLGVTIFSGGAQAANLPSARVGRTFLLMVAGDSDATLTPAAGEAINLLAPDATLAIPAGHLVLGSCRVDGTWNVLAFPTTTVIHDADFAARALVNDPGDTNPIPVSAVDDVICGMRAAAAVGVETRTLPDPTFIGQKCFLYMYDSAGADIDVTPDSDFDQSGANTKITFNAIGDSVSFTACAVGGVAAPLRWRQPVTDGTTLS